MVRRFFLIFILSLISCKQTDREIEGGMNKKLSKFCKEQNISFSNKHIDTLFYKKWQGDDYQYHLYYDIIDTVRKDTISASLFYFDDDGMFIYSKNGEYHIKR